MTFPVIVIGAGGHAKVVLDVLLLRGQRVIGLLDADPKKKGQEVFGVPVLGGDDVLTSYTPSEVSLVLGVGSSRGAERRRALYESLRQRGYRFLSLAHPSAIIARMVEIGDGSIVMAGAVVQPGCRIGANCIVNTGARVDHDCQIGDHVHVAPGAILCGDVCVGADSHVGAGATIIQGVKVGSSALVAAGALVIDNIPDRTTVLGIPARKRRS